MQELAGRLYVGKLYRVDAERAAVVDLLKEAVAESGARVVYCSFPDQRVAPVYIGAEDDNGRRYGLLVYPFTTTRRQTRHRPPDERRSQVRFGDPVKGRDEVNLVAKDVAGVDVTLVLTVDPEERFIVGLDPLVYEDLPIGISVYYQDRQVEAAREHGWAVWERAKKGGRRRPSWAGLETLVGFRPERLLDYVRFEAKATGLGLSPALRFKLAQSFEVPGSEPHRLETFFGLDAATILDIVETNFRLGIVVRVEWPSTTSEKELAQSPVVASVTPVDADGKPDFQVVLADGAELRVECKTASPERYRNGDYKVEVQKTRDSAVGRKYTFDQFDVLAACLFPSTGLWEYRYRWTRDLVPWTEDQARVQPVQRVDAPWASSIAELVRG